MKEKEYIIFHILRDVASSTNFLLVMITSLQHFQYQNSKCYNIINMFGSCMNKGSPHVVHISIRMSCIGFKYFLVLHKLCNANRFEGNDIIYHVGPWRELSMFHMDLSITLSKFHEHHLYKSKRDFSASCDFIVMSVMYQHKVHLTCYFNFHNAQRNFILKMFNS